MTPKHQAGRGKCAACAHPEADALNRALVTGVSLRKLGQKYGISAMSLHAHKKNHLSPALTVVKQAPSSAGTSAISRVEAIIAKLEGYIATAEKQGLSAQALASVRELRATVELLAKLSGELDERATLVVNLATTSEWVNLRTIILTTLQQYPDALRALADKLALLNTHDNGHTTLPSTSSLKEN